MGEKADCKSDKVKVWQGQEKMVTYDLGRLNPLAKFHGVAPQTRLTYPLCNYGSQQREKMEKTYEMFYLENKYVKVTVCPQLGGRAWAFYDKISGKDIFMHNNQVKPYNGGTGNGYTAGGLEVNIPDAHSITNIRKRECQAICRPDGSASIIVSEWERTRRLRWSFAFTLYPDGAYLEHSLRLQNRTSFPISWKYWANPAVEATEGLQVVFPEPRVIRHGTLPDEFSWPIYGNRDLSWWKNLSEVLGLYSYDVREGFFGYYNYDFGMGMVHSSDPYLLPGKKYWSWGNNKLGEERRSDLTGNNKIYVEIQAGRIENQDHLEMLNPFDQASWTERWYPIRKIGTFCMANDDAAVSIRLQDPDDSGAGKLIVGVATPVALGKVEVEVTFNDKVIHKCQASLCPEEPLLCDLDQVVQQDQLHQVQVQVRTADGRKIITARTKQAPPDRGDLLVVPDELQRKEPRTINGTFHNAYFDEIHTHGNESVIGYADALKQDPNNVEALVALARWEAKAGNFDSAMTRLQRAVKLDEYTVDAYGYMAKLYELNGDIEESRAAYNRLIRYGKHHWGYFGLGRLALVDKDYQGAAKLFAKALEYDARDVRSMVLQAVALCQAGQNDKAKQLLDQALREEPSDMVAKFQLYLIGSNDAQSHLDAIKEQLEHDPEGFVELAVEYGNCGLYCQAIEMLKNAHQGHATTLFYLGYYADRLGDCKTAEDYFKKACSAEKDYVHAYRIESVKVLQTAIKYLPDASAPYYYLGSIRAGFAWWQGALESWKTAEQMGEKYYGLYRNMAAVLWKLADDPDAALEYYRKAAKLAPKEDYLIEEYCELLESRGLDDELKEVLEADEEMSIGKHGLFTKYVNLCGKVGEFEKGEAILKKANFSYWWEEALCMAYQKFCILQGLDNLDKQQYAQAIQDFERIFELPGNLGYTRSCDYEDQRANYLIAWCYEKLGMDDKAKEIWLKTIETVYEARWDVGAHVSAWRARYYQALCLQKLGRWGEANVYLDGLKEYALANKRGSDAILPLESQIAAIRLARVTEDVFKDESQVAAAGALVELRTVDVET